MSLTREEAIASLHVVVAVAKADERLAAEERRAIELALEDAGLDRAIDAKALFNDDFEIDDHLAVLKSPEARDEAYRSAYSLAFADGDCSKEERELLATLRGRLDISPERERELSRLFALLSGEAAEKQIPLKPIADPHERHEAIRAATRQCALVSALLGAFPIPGLALVTDLAVIAMQVGLVRDIGAMSGQLLDKRAAKTLLAGVGVSGARLAISNLAKLLPGWGSVVGATTSFASSYAVGRVFERHFSGTALSSDESGDRSRLRADYKAAEAEGRLEYEANKDEIAAKQRASQAEIEQLTRDVKDGKLTSSELVERASMLP